MVARVLTLCLALLSCRAAMADLPPEAAWLKLVPAETDIAIRLRGLGIVKADLAKMITAMSPTVAEQAGPILDGIAAQFEGQFGQSASEGPVTILMRIPPPNANTSFTYALVVKSNNYDGIKKAIGAGNEVKAVLQPGGYEKFNGTSGEPLYTLKGDGFVTYGGDETLVAGMARPDGKIAWTEILADSFLRGDLGVFINAASIQKRYAEQFEAARNQAIASLDQNPDPAGDGNKESMKELFRNGFDAIKLVDSLAFFLDFEPYGLVVAGTATVQPGSQAAAKLAATKPTQGVLLETLPSDGTFFFDLCASPEMTTKLQKTLLAMKLGSSASKNEEMKQALLLIEQAGITEMATTTFGTSGTLSLALANDPQKAVDGTIGSIQALKGSSDFIKSVKLLPASNFQGFTLNDVEVTVDLEKLPKPQPGEPAEAVEARKKLGDKVHYWVGSNGGRVLVAQGASWETAKSQIEAVASGQGTLAKLPNYATLREQMPGRTNFLMMGSAQGLVREVGRQMSAQIPGGVDLKPGEMPREIALFGATFAATPAGYQFELRLPSANGPVFEKGFTPILQGLQGKVGM